MAKPEKIKIGFAGTPEIAFAHFNHLLNSANIDIGFVLTQPNKKSGRGLEESKTLFNNIGRDIPIIQPDNLNDQATINEISKMKIDLLVVVAYGKILPDWVLEYPKFGCLNIHFSLLPKWRGAAPIQKAIANGDKLSGISFMKIVNELDAGPIYASFNVDIEDNDFFQAEEKLLEVSLMHISSVINEIVVNNKQPKEQDSREVTYAEKIDRGDGLVNWSWGAKEIKNKFLAYRKWPLLSFMFKNEEVQIHDLEIASDQAGTPGTITEFTKESLSVFCGDGVINIKAVKFPGKKVISSIDFFNAKRDIISSGDILV